MKLLVFKMVRVAFLHPDLGIGGAEQLIVNLALLCKSNGWYVKIITPYFDPKRAFAPTTDGSLNVEVHGNWFPRRIFGRFQALCEYIRIFIASLYLILWGGKYDLVIVDQIPISLPLLKLRFRTFFYCHFPDKLLCVERKSILKKIYRFFIDTLEEFCILWASIIVVNSNFTREIFRTSFRMISFLRKPPSVVYPCSDLKYFDSFDVKREDLQGVQGLESLKRLKNDELKDAKFIVSLNRYERKKNLSLAVESYIEFMNSIQKSDYPSKHSSFYLIVAGGYDERLQENIEVYNTLKNNDFGNFKENVFFLRSISNLDRSILLKSADLVVYTPRNEHFGIVPCEAMYCGAPVLAHKSGGPIETVKEGVGFLMENEDPALWGSKISEYFKGKRIDKDQLRRYVLENFSLERMNRDFLQALQNRYGRKLFQRIAI